MPLGSFSAHAIVFVLFVLIGVPHVVPHVVQCPLQQTPLRRVEVLEPCAEGRNIDAEVLRGLLCRPGPAEYVGEVVDVDQSAGGLLADVRLLAGLHPLWDGAALVVHEFVGETDRRSAKSIPAAHRDGAGREVDAPGPAVVGPLEAQMLALVQLGRRVPGTHPRNVGGTSDT